MTGKEFIEEINHGKFVDVRAGMPEGIYVIGLLAGKKNKINGNSVDLVSIIAKKFASEEEASDYEFDENDEFATFEVGNKVCGTLGVGRAIDQQKAAENHTLWAVEMHTEVRKNDDPNINSGKDYKTKIWTLIGKLD